MSGEWRCTNDHLVTDVRATLCPECSADVMWVSSGERERPAPPPTRGDHPYPADRPSGWSYVVMGMGLLALAGIIAVLADESGWFVAAIIAGVLGQVLVAVGVIAEGIVLGLRIDRHDRAENH